MRLRNDLIIHILSYAYHWEKMEIVLKQLSK